jgi:hypothetical protein
VPATHLRTGERARADGSADVLEIDGPASVSATAIIDNRVSATSASGAATALGAFFDLDGDPQPVMMKNSLVRGNIARASTPDGPVGVLGAGIANGGHLQLHNVLVSGNSGTASGTSGNARGGGICNGMPLAPDGPTPQLTLDHTLVTHNALNASAGLSRKAAACSRTAPVHQRKQPDRRQRASVADHAPRVIVGPERVGALRAAWRGYGRGMVGDGRRRAATASRAETQTRVIAIAETRDRLEAGHAGPRPARLLLH